MDFVSCFQEFGCRDDDSAVILNKEVAETVTELLGLESVDDLSFALTTLRTVTRGMHIDYNTRKMCSYRYRICE